MRNRSTILRVLWFLLCGYVAFAIYKMLGNEKDRPPATNKDDAAIEKERDRWEDVPFRPAAEEDSRLKHLGTKDSRYLSTARGWQSVGAIIVAEQIHSVELDILGLDRFHITPQSSDETEEARFCPQLRKIGGKWRGDDSKWEEATLYRVGRMWPDESQMLYLEWPKGGGVWVLRCDPWWEPEKSMGRVYNAFTIEKRCETIEMLGGTFL